MDRMFNSNFIDLNKKTRFEEQMNKNENSQLFLRINQFDLLQELKSIRFLTSINDKFEKAKILEFNIHRIINN